MVFTWCTYWERSLLSQAKLTLYGRVDDFFKALCMIPLLVDFFSTIGMISSVVSNSVLTWYSKLLKGCVCYTSIVFVDYVLSFDCFSDVLTFYICSFWSFTLHLNILPFFFECRNVDSLYVNFSLLLKVEVYDAFKI